MKNLVEKEWREKLQASENAVIVDVRSPSEWHDGIIPDSILVNIMDGPDFMEQMRSWDKSKEFYVYCRSGNRSFQACRIMAKEGFICYNLKEGIMAWQGDILEPVNQ